MPNLHVHEIIMLETGALVTGRQTAVLAPATITDRGHTAAGWRYLDELAFGAEVDQVDHYGKHTTVQGGLLSIKSLETGQRDPFMVTSIRLVRCSDLTAQEIDELGHASRASFDAGLAGALGSRRAWFIRLIPYQDGPLL